MIPWFLKSCAPQILTTGKYLNVIQSSAEKLKNEFSKVPPFAGPIEWSTVDRTYEILLVLLLLVVLRSNLPIMQY